MKQKMINLGLFFKSKITNSDMFPLVVNFTCDGKNNFQTFFGGFLSIIIKMLVFGIAISLTITIIQKGNSSFNVTTIQQDMTSDEEKYYFAQKDIFIGITLVGPDSDLLLNSSYFNFEMNQVSYFRDNSSIGSSFNKTNIPFEYWKVDVSKIESSISQTIKDRKYLCPKNKDIYVRSNYNTDRYETFEISFSKCQGNYWRSDSEIDSIFANNIVELQIISTYFDINDYVNPVHYIAFKIKDINFNVYSFYTKNFKIAR